MGIVICGLNGCGKSTLGKAIAEKLGAQFIDSEDLFFVKTDASYPYEVPRSREEAEQTLRNRVKHCKNFVLASVKGDYGEEVLPFYDYVVLMEVPKEIRRKRIRNRSFQKFGSRMLPGGDLYEKEQVFFDMAESRPESYVENWVETLKIPILRVDGRKTVEENTAYVLSQIRK